MADFCNYCVKEVFGDVEPDIDVYKIFDELKIGYMTPVICEGCGMIGVAKDEHGKLKVIYQDIGMSDYYDKRKLDR